jgi:hypothetical protein
MEDGQRIASLRIARIELRRLQQGRFGRLATGVVHVKSGLALMRDDTRMPDVAKFVEELVPVREEAIRLEGPTARAAEEVELIADEIPE